MTSLDQIICDYQKNKQQDASGSDKRLMSCVSLGSDEKTVKMASCLGAHSEEVIPTSAAEAEALLENRDKSELKKCEWFHFLHVIIGTSLLSGILFDVCTTRQLQSLHINDGTILNNMFCFI